MLRIFPAPRVTKLSGLRHYGNLDKAFSLPAVELILSPAAAEACMCAAKATNQNIVQSLVSRIMHTLGRGSEQIPCALRRETRCANTTSGFRLCSWWRLSQFQCSQEPPDHMVPEIRYPFVFVSQSKAEVQTAHTQNRRDRTCLGSR